MFDDPSPIMSGPPPPSYNPEPAPPDRQPETRPNVLSSVSLPSPHAINLKQEQGQEQSSSRELTCLLSEDSPVYVLQDLQTTKTKRPLSYPCGPQPKTDLPIGVNLSKRNSDPPKPVTVSNQTKVKAQVKPFTKESLERLERKTVQLVREYGFQPRRKLSVEDGSRLPAKYEPFPKNLYGRPLEEIDNFIYDEVCVQINNEDRIMIILRIDVLKKNQNIVSAHDEYSKILSWFGNILLLARDNGEELLLKFWKNLENYACN
ncbi:hypothetical protein Trydic_g15579 [Trypoxylus dichotomus]